MTDITADPITPAPDQDPNAAKLHADRDRLIAILATHNVAVAVIKFDGSGDEGQIGDIDFFAADSAIIGTLEPPEPLASRAGAPIPSLKCAANRP